MGIRFFCSTCHHRLNVKSFLAGKRGVCPQCGAGLDIPLESQIRKDASDKGGDEAGEGSDAVTSSSPVTAVRPVGEQDVPQVAGAPDGPWFAVPMSAPTAAQPPIPIGTAAAPTSPRPNGFSPTPAVPVGLAVPMQAAVPLGVPVLAQPTAPAVGSVPGRLGSTVQPVLAGAPTVPVPVAVPVVAHVVALPIDPLEESPEAIWYVRPPSGGQYGPARGDIMRKWLYEGRVSQDSLVWREGWQDWRIAGQVFPGLAPAAAPPAPTPLAVAAYTPTSPRTSAAHPGYRPRRRSSLALAVATVAVLALMSVALLIILVAVISKA